MNEKTILLIEDNPGDEVLTLRALKKNSISSNVVVKRDGAEALDYLQAPLGGPDGAFAPLPQLVLLDLNLPKISGLEVLRRIRADTRTKLLPVVILTSSLEDTDIVRSYGFGANGYVRKPVDFVQFAEAVRQIGLYWLIINQPPPTTQR
jgi:two-component system response regulator